MERKILLSFIRCPNDMKAGMYRDRDYTTGKLLDIAGISYRRLLLICDMIRENGLGVTTVLDDDYPRNMLSSVNPPFLIYHSGDLSDDPVTAVLASRSSDGHVCDCAYDIAMRAGCMGQTILVSGASYAEKRIIASGIRCYVCVPYGIGKRDIRDNATLISVFPPDVRMNRATLSVRNQMTALLSDRAVIFPDKVTSGLMNVASLMLDNGRDVYLGECCRYTPGGRHLADMGIPLL